MIVLGISCYMSDAAAALVGDGKIIAACEEERFTRKKHDGNFPLNAIQYCLDEAEINISQVDHVAYYIDPWYQFGNRMLEVARFLPASLSLASGYGGKWKNMLFIRNDFRKCFGLNGKLPFSFHFVEHHLAHAASTFLVSPYEESAILTMDESGEFTSTLFSHGTGKKINKLDYLGHPHSVGSFYKAVTGYLGFPKQYQEGKVMGLASYGEPDQRVGKLVKTLNRNKFKLDLSYFGLYASEVSQKFRDEFGTSREAEGPITKHEEDVAAGLQEVTEEIGLEFSKYLCEKTGSKNICLAGGVALNCVMNGRILRETPFENIYVQPAASDAGGAVGAAFYTYFQESGAKREFMMDTTYYGPGFSDDELEAYLKKQGIAYTRHENIEEVAAGLLNQQKIIGWFQGRMEFGPRALGNRSILADPRQAEMKDIINEKVKHREGFRPFAPSCLEEDKDVYFEAAAVSPFMLLVFYVKPDKRSVIPAITHVDGTARVQTVNQNQNKRYWNLINEFKKLSGVGVVLNTSFNVRGEPIVCTAEEAYNCFLITEMDCFVAGKCLVQKDERQKG